MFKKYILVALLSNFLFISSAAQANSDNFISFKQGQFGDYTIGSIEADSFYWSKNQGQLREIEFNYGNKELARIVGGVRVDSGNNISNYFLGYIFSDDSQFRVRTLTVSDQLMFKTDGFFVVGIEKTE